MSPNRTILWFVRCTAHISCKISGAQRIPTLCLVDSCGTMIAKDDAAVRVGQICNAGLGRIPSFTAHLVVGIISPLKRDAQAASHAEEKSNYESLHLSTLNASPIDARKLMPRTRGYTISDHGSGLVTILLILPCSPIFQPSRFHRFPYIHPWGPRIVAIYLLTVRINAQ